MTTASPLLSAPGEVSNMRRMRPTRERVLVVEDQPQLLELTGLMLETAGLTVMRAANASECLGILECETPDLILLDINLPDLCGFDLCHQIKDNPRYAGVPVVHLSGDHVSSEDQALGLNAGADGYITRPITQYELIARVESILRMRRTDNELRKVTNQLRTTSRALQQMMDYSLDAICTVSEAGVFGEVSAAAEKMWGYSRAELSGMPFLDLVHPSDVPKSLAMFEAVGRGEATRDFENRFVHKNGDVVILMWSAYWSETDRKMFCVARDVTEGRATERALDRMGKRLQTTLECMSDAFYLLDREYRFAYLNREAERLLKVSRRDLLQRCIWEVFSEAKESETQVQFQRCFEKNESGHFEIYYSQFERWFEFDAFPSEEGLAVYFRDSTEKKRSRDLLAESHERFLNLVRATNHAMWDWDLKREEMWWAVGFENRLGYDMAKIDPKARFWYENIHPEERERVYRSLCRCIESGGRTWGDEYRFRRADGTYAYVHDRGYIVHDEQGKPSRVVGGILDMSERHEQEQKLRESEERFRQFAENVGDAFWIMDAESKELLFTNPAFRRVHGCESPVSYLDSIHPEDRDRVRRAGENLRSGYSDEHRLMRPDGSIIRVWTRMVPVYDTEGRIYRIAGIQTDITERKVLENQVLRAQRMESIGTLAGGIAHDLNNVLTPIIMSIELLRTQVEEADGQNILDTIEASASRGADMVQQVLSFAKGVDGERVPIQTRHLLKEIHKIVGETFPKNIDLKVVIEPELWNVRGDPTQIHQVLLNLCVNARDAMPNGGRITITVRNELIDEKYAVANFEARVGPHVRIDVEDTGCGIPPESIEKIFDPFYTTKEIGHGSGLGLSTSLAIVKSHGGFIRVTSEVACGSKFIVHLPATTGTEEPPDDSPFRNLPRGHGELILLIEDESSIRTVTRRTLETFGYRVMPACDGAEAIAVYARNQPEVSVVVTDMMMPVMDGAATIEVLRRMNPEVRIIAASGMSADLSLTRAIHPNVHCVLAKPYSTEAILNAVADTLGGQVR